MTQWKGRKEKQSKVLLLLPALEAEAEAAPPPPHHCHCQVKVAGRGFLRLSTTASVVPHRPTPTIANGSYFLVHHGRRDRRS
jgi:hypothetical protein